MEPLEERLALVEKELEVQLAMHAAITPILSALMTTHQDFPRMQLQLTTLIEVADGRSLWSKLTAEQRAIARTYVEALQSLHPAPTAAAQPGARPLG